MTEKITHEQFKATLKSVVDANPDYIYAEGGVGLCFYSVAAAERAEDDGQLVANTTVGCVIGETLRQLLPAGIFYEHVKFSTESALLTIRGWNRLHGFFASPEATGIYAQQVQRGQDRGLSWGEALAEAERP